MPRRVIPMVRPPMHAQGGVGDPFGNSGAPGMPGRDRQKEARDEVVQNYALARGRFSERIFVFPQFNGLTAGQQDTQYIEVKSNGDSFVRLVAMRGVITSDTLPLTGQEPNATFFRMEIDGLEDVTTSGKTNQPVSFGVAFSEEAAPWFWFASPPLIRVGNTMAVTINVTAALGTEATITPQFALRLVDDAVWNALYAPTGVYDQVDDSE